MKLNAILDIDDYPVSFAAKLLAELREDIAILSAEVAKLDGLISRLKSFQPQDPAPAKAPPSPPSRSIEAPGAFTSWSPARLRLMHQLDRTFAHDVVVQKLNALPGRPLTSKAVHNMRYRLKKEAEKLRPADPICEAKEEVAPTVPEPVAVADEPAPMPSPPPPRKVRVSDIVVSASDDPFDVKMFAAGEAKLGNQRAGLEPQETFGPSSGISKGGGPDVQLIDANFADIRAWAAQHGCKYVGTNIGDVNRLRLKHGKPQVRLSMSARPVPL